jgi:hypothetical protein
MSHKKFIFFTAGLSVSLILLISLLFYYIDPLFYYRKTNLYRPQYIATERYQMAGLIKTMEYETLFTATSMGRNFRESYVNQKLNTKSFNASLPASTAKEQAMVAESALRNKDHIKQIIWELNYYSFAGDPDWVAGPPSDFPKYMYDDSVANDIRYLFNSYTVEVFYKNILGNIKGDEGRRDVESLYKFGENFPKENLDRIANSLQQVPIIPQLPENEKYETMIKSFKENVIPLVKNHPDTKFTFFFAPYPVYNHVMFYKKHPDYLTERIKFKKQVYTLLSQYPNAEFYDFQDEKKITYNISNYMADGVHYYDFINNWIIDYIAEKSPIQSLEQYNKKLTNFKNQVTTFHIDKLYADDSLKKAYVSTMSTELPQ